jgi:hypothetical protein
MLGILDPPRPWFPVLQSLVRHPDMKKFGDTMVLITDTEEFMRRLQEAARLAGYDLHHERVRYVERNCSADMGPFCKFTDYSYESEWRFMTREPINGDSLVLQLGSIRDIADPVELESAWAAEAAPPGM